MSALKMRMFIRPSGLAGEIDVAAPGRFAHTSTSPSYLMVAGAIAGIEGSPLIINNLDAQQRQASQKTIDSLVAMGARIRADDTTVTVLKSDLNRIARIDTTDISDIVPALAIAASQSNGLTYLQNMDNDAPTTIRLYDMLKALKINVDFTEEGLAIFGGGSMRGAELQTYGDSRLVIAASLAGLVARGETVVQDPTSIKDSYPGFFDDLRALGGNVTVMSNTFGIALKMTIIGESHAKDIGVIVEGVPSGTELSQAFIQSQLEERRSKGPLTTTRREQDFAEIATGVVDGVAVGGPIRIMIANSDVKSGPYKKNEF